VPSAGQDPGDLFPLVVADLFEAAGALRRAGERSAAAAGQTHARWQVMSAVSTGDWTVPMVAQRLGTSRQAVQRIVNQLVAEGLARLETNPRHRRSPLLRLTPAGRETLARVTGEATREHADVLEQLRDVDLAALRAALEQLTSAVRAGERSDRPSS